MLACMSSGLVVFELWRTIYVFIVLFIDRIYNVNEFIFWIKTLFILVFWPKDKRKASWFFLTFGNAFIKKPVFCKESLCGFEYWNLRSILWSKLEYKSKSCSLVDSYSLGSTTSFIKGISLSISALSQAKISWLLYLFLKEASPAEKFWLQ